MNTLYLFLLILHCFVNRSIYNGSGAVVKPFLLSIEILIFRKQTSFVEKFKKFLDIYFFRLPELRKIVLHMFGNSVEI